MSLWTELKRRNIFRVAAAYVVIGWLTLQVADIVLGFTGAPEWVGKALIALLLLGVIPVLALAWVFEVGPGGIRVDDGTVQRDAGPQARRLDVVTLGAVILVMLLMVGQHLVPALLDLEPSAPRSSGAVVAPSPIERTPRPVPASDFTAPEGSIAVLPFANRSADADTEYFVDGIHDDLLTELSRNPQLTVISRTSVRQYRDTTKTLRTIGNELGVAHVLEGAIQRAGQRVRINAQLIDAETDAHLWADNFDRELTPENIFEIQSEIATAIAAALGRALGVETTDDGPSAITSDAEAFDLFLRARAISELTTEVSIRERIALYRDALEQDPEFALAMSELGREYTNLYWYVTRREEDRRRGGEWIDRALGLAPENAQIQLARAEYLYRADLDYEGALAALERAEQGLPGEARIFKIRAYVLRRAGDLDKALEVLQTAVLLDPRSQETLDTVIETHWLKGDLAAARRWGERAVALPDSPPSVAMTVPAAELQVAGDTEAAVRAMDALDPAIPITTGFFAPIDRFRWSLLARDYERAAAELEELAVSEDLFEDQFYLIPIELLRAQLAQATGDGEGQQRHADEALEVLDRVLENHPGDYRAWAQRGIALALLDRMNEALESLNHAIEQDVPRRDSMIMSEMERTRLFMLAIGGRTSELVAALEPYLAGGIRYWDIDGLVLYPPFDRHRGDPALERLVARYTRKGSAP